MKYMPTFASVGHPSENCLLVVSHQRWRAFPSAVENNDGQQRQVRDRHNYN